MNLPSCTRCPRATSGATHRYSGTSTISPLPSASAPAGDDGGRRLADDHEISSQRARLRIAQIQPHHLVERRAAASGDLPQSGESRPGVDDPPPVPALILRVLVEPRRPP